MEASSTDDAPLEDEEGDAVDIEVPPLPPTAPLDGSQLIAANE